MIIVCQIVEKAVGGGDRGRGQDSSLILGKVVGSEGLAKASEFHIKA